MVLLKQNNLSVVARNEAISSTVSPFQRDCRVATAPRKDDTINVITRDEAIF